MTAVIVDGVPIDREVSVLAVELAIGRDRVIGQRDRAENSLHRRARLERILDRRVVQPVVDVGAAGADVGHRDHFAGKRIEHDCAAALRAALNHFRRQLGFGERLDRRIDRQLELRARLRRLERQRAVENRMAQRVTIEAQLDRFAARQLVVLQLQPGEPLAVHPRQPHHRRGQVALRVKPLVFADRADAVDSERFHGLRFVRRDSTLEPHERRVLVQLRFERNRQHHQDCGELRRARPACSTRAPGAGARKPSASRPIAPAARHCDRRSVRAPLRVRSRRYARGGRASSIAAHRSPPARISRITAKPNNAASASVSAPIRVRRCLNDVFMGASPPARGRAAQDDIAARARAGDRAS